MGGTHADTETTVDLFLRAGGTTSWEHQQRVIDHLDRLEAAGAIDRYRVQVWGQAVSVAGPLSQTRFHRAASGAVRELEEWAGSRTGEVSLPFEHEKVTCEFTDQRHRMIRLPVVCLAVYEGDTLTEVYPRVEDGEVHSVDDLLEDADPPEGGSRENGTVAFTGTGTGGPPNRG